MTAQEACRLLSGREKYSNGTHRCRFGIHPRHCLPTHPECVLYGVLLQQQTEVRIPSSLFGLRYCDIHGMAIDKNVLLVGIRPSVVRPQSSVERLQSVEFSNARTVTGRYRTFARRRCGLQAASSIRRRSTAALNRTAAGHPCIDRWIGRRLADGYREQACRPRPAPDVAERAFSRNE
jgi:hypothetical protein